METTQTKLQKERAKRKLRKQKKQEAKALLAVKKEQKEKEEIKTEPEVEVEYVVVNPFENADAETEEFQEFKEIFNHFLKVEGEDEKKKEETANGQGVTSGKTPDAPVKEEKLSKKKRKLQRRFLV